jgi:N-dimethylarginine dimethylaminohydrolase
MVPSMPLFLMSPPRRDWGVRGRANPFSARFAPGADLGAQAVRDWLSVADAIVRAGGDVAVVPAPDDASLTGLPYVAEAGHMGVDQDGPVFLVARLTPPHRQGEAQHLARTFASWGWRTRSVGVPWEGQGDVLRIDAQRTMLTSGVGRYARTHASAFPIVAAHLATRVQHVRFRADPWFHGNTFFGAFTSTRGTKALVCEAAIAREDRASLAHFLEGVELVPIDRALSLAYATNALQVNDTVLAPAGLPPAIHALWRALGLRVEELTLPALFGKGGGAAVCLTNRVEGATIASVPAAARYENARASIAATEHA